MIKATLFAALLISGTLYAQETAQGMDAILRQIEQNNPQLQANAQLAEAQRWENRAENNLEDPRLSYSHVWDSRDSHITEGELVVSQGFDFPTLYLSRHRLNRLRDRAIDAEAAQLRQEVLLEAQELCIDIITLHRQLTLGHQRLHNAEELQQAYTRRLEQGESGILESNRIELELLNTRTEVRRTQTELEAKTRQLLALNGNQPLTAGRPLADPVPPTPQALGLTDYPVAALPDDFRPLCAQLLQASPALQALENRQNASQQQRSVARQGWLPKLEVGYRRNTDSGHPLNGVVVGCSFPIFQNRGRSSQARAQLQADRLNAESTRLSTASALWQLYEEARTLQGSIHEYQSALGRQQNLSLLGKALDGGQISLTEYFVEANAFYQSQSNLLLLQGDYHKALARLYQSLL